jgi:hypothetical protein
MASPSSSSSSHSCMICFDEMASDFSAMPCGHVFHFNCLRDMHTATTNEPTDQERQRGVTKLKFQCPLRCSSGKAISLRDVLRLHLQLETTSDGSGSIKKKSGSGKEDKIVIDALEDISILKEEELRTLITSLHSKLEVSINESEQRIHKLEEDLSEGKKALIAMREDVKVKDDQLREYEEQLSECEGKLETKTIELLNSKNTVQDLKSRLDLTEGNYKRRLTLLNDELTRVREDNKSLHTRMSAVDFKTTGLLDTLESERAKNISRRLAEGSNEFTGTDHVAWKKGFKACEDEERATFLGLHARLSRVEEERDQAVKAKQVAENNLKTAMIENRQVTEELNKKKVILNDTISKKRTGDASFLQLQERYDELKRKMSINGVGATSSIGFGQMSSSTTTSQGIVRSGNSNNNNSSSSSSSSIAGMINQEKMGSIFSKPFASSTTVLPSWPLQQENPVQRINSIKGLTSTSNPPGHKPSAPPVPKHAEQSTIQWAVAPVPKAAISAPKPPSQLFAPSAPKPFFQTALSQVVVDLAADDENEDDRKPEISAPSGRLEIESSQLSRKRSFPVSERDVNAPQGEATKKNPVQMSLKTSWAITKGE